MRLGAQLRGRAPGQRRPAQGGEDGGEQLRDARAVRSLDQGDRDRRALGARVLGRCVPRHEVARDGGLAVVARPDHQQVVGPHPPAALQDAFEPLADVEGAAVADPEVAVDAREAAVVGQLQRIAGKRVEVRRVGQLGGHVRSPPPR